MESLSHRDITEKFSLVCSVFPYYSYAYECAQLLRAISKRSQEGLNQHFDALVNSFVKRNLTISSFNEFTEKMLEKEMKYRLFELDVHLDVMDHICKFYEFYQKHIDTVFSYLNLYFDDFKTPLANNIVDIMETSNQFKDNPQKIVEIFSPSFDDEPDENQDEEVFYKNYETLKCYSDLDISYISYFKNLKYLNTLYLNEDNPDGNDFNIHVKSIIVQMSVVPQLGKERFTNNEFLETIINITGNDCSGDINEIEEAYQKLK